MKYTKLGKTGITVSKLCLGMMSFGNTQSWMLELDRAKPIVNRALDAGINFFDTANVYSKGRSEEITGELLKNSRDNVVVATKVRFAMGEGVNDYGLNKYHISRQIEASLKRLNMDFVELYQIHRWDYNTDIEYVLRSLNKIIDDGKTLHIGVSSMYAWELAKAQYTAEKLGLEKFSTMQNHYNAMYREEEREIIPFCIDQGMGVIPWSPLARGFLSGKYKRNEKNESVRYLTDPYLKSRYFRNNDFDIVETVVEIATEENLFPAQIALAWVLNRPGITSPIIGVTNLDQLEHAIASVDIKLNTDTIKRIDEVYSSRPIIGHSYNQPDSMVKVQR